MGIAISTASQLLTNDDGEISMTGVAAANTSTSRHIGISLSGVTVQAENGDIYMKGTGADSSTNSRGMYIVDGTLIENTASSATPATITIIGEAGNITTAANGHQTGITLNSGIIKSGYADIFLEGTSGSNVADYSRGVHIASGGSVSSTGTGADAANIDIQAFLLSAAGTDFLLQEQSLATSSVNSVDGDIAVTAGTDIKGGALSINASTGANTSTIYSSGAGDVTLTAKGSTASRGVIQTSANGTTTVGSATGSGVYQLIADTLDIKASTSFIHAGELVLRPYLSATTVGVGATTSTLKITDSILNKISNASMLWLGGYTGWMNSGDITVDASATPAVNVTVASGAALTVDDAFASANTATFLSVGDVTLNDTLSSTSNAANALVLSTEGKFINNAGANALSAANSRWLLYSDNPVDNTRSGLLPDASEFGKTYAANAPASIGAGNRFIYATNTRPTIVAAVDDRSVTYGDAFSDTNTLSYVSGLITGDTLTNIGLTGDAAFNVTHQLTDVAGFYAGAITASSGTLATVLGYDFTLNAGGLTVDKAVLTVDVDDASREYGEINPAFTGSVSGWKNGQDLNDLSNAIVYSTTATQTSGAGTAVISAQGGVEQNYDFNYVTGILTIDPATLTITLTIPNPTRQVGQANPSFDLSYSGFKLGQDSTAITAPTANTVANAGSAAGFYDITLSGGSAANYVFQHAPVLGQLQVTGVVTPPPPPVTNPLIPATVVQVAQDNITKTTTIKETSNTPGAVAFEESLVRNSGSIGQQDTGQNHKKFSTMLKGLLSIHPEVIRLFNLAQK